TGENIAGNGGNGVFIYGTQQNVIGGATPTEGPAPGNLISGNAQAGVAIFSPAFNAPAMGNLVAGNLIGTDLTGKVSLGNKSDCVDIFSGQNNQIGELNGINVISGNQGNGVLIAQLSIVPATGNTLSGNYIGVGSDGITRVANTQNGVLVENASGNHI